MRKVGGVLAHFHADVREVRDAGSPVVAVERRFERNVHELLVCVEQRGELARVQALGRLAHAFITAHAHTFQARAAGGRVREGHGDLRAEHVLLDGEVQVVDCVEFERGLRELDVADDLAFLVFDLAAQGGERVGRLLVGGYRDAGGDPGDDSLIAFYAAYRALVRAKIALVRASQLPAGSAEDGHEHARACELIGVAERFAWRARLPLVIVVCGLPASGKSHLARALAEMSGLPHLGSDVTRKRLAGVRSAQRASPESYTLSGTAAPTLSWRAAAWPRWKGAAGRSSMPPSVTWPTAKRSPPRWGAGAPLLYLECHAPRAVLVERAGRRDRDPDRISDADAAVVRRELERWESLDEVPASAHLALRTDRPLEQIVEGVLALLDRRLFCPTSVSQ